MSIVGTGYEFTVVHNGVEKVVYPLNYRSCSVKYDEQDGLIFLRKKFSGELIFYNDSSNYIDDFDYFFTIDRDRNQRCQEVTLNIYKDGVVCFEGYFTTNKGKIDVDNCTFKITPEPNDKYRLIFNAWKIQHNLVGKDSLGNYLINQVTVKSPNLVNPPPYDYTHCRWLIDLIEYLCQQMVPSSTVSSIFFSDANDYVTLTTSKINHLAIAQKSDIITPDASEPATKAMISFSELMDILRIMFNVYWDYDSDTNEFTIEHISFFTDAEIKDIQSDPLAKSTKKYSYDSISIPKQETFEMMEAKNDDFVGKPIIYNSPCVGTDDDSAEKKYQISVTTDIQWIEHPQGNTEVSKEGFVILACYDNAGDWTIREDVGYITLVNYENAALSWANLLMNYHRHDRFLISGSINGHEMDFISTKKIIIQDEFSIKNCDCPIELPVKYKTKLGDEVLGGEYGLPSSIEMDFTGKVKLNLKYGEPENVNGGVQNPEIVQWGGFPTVSGADPSDYCLLPGGCENSDLAMAYINPITKEMFWDSAGTNKINQTGFTRYYFIGCNWIQESEFYGYPGYTDYIELDENSIYINSYSC